MDVLAINDGRLQHERVERIRRLRPDMILLAGGIDSNEDALKKKCAEMAELIAAADPRPRLGHSFKLPLIYSGNEHATHEVEQALAKRTATRRTDYRQGLASSTARWRTSWCPTSGRRWRPRTCSLRAPRSRTCSKST